MRNFSFTIQVALPLQILTKGAGRRTATSQVGEKFEAGEEILRSGAKESADPSQGKQGLKLKSFPGFCGTTEVVP